MDFSELYLTYYSKLVRFAKEFVILEEDAENITQDVFTDLWAKRDSMDRIENMNNAVKFFTAGQNRQAFFDFFADSD